MGFSVQTVNVRRLLLLFFCFLSFEVTSLTDGEYKVKAHSRFVKADRCKHFRKKTSYQQAVTDVTVTHKSSLWDDSGTRSWQRVVGFFKIRDITLYTLLTMKL